MNVTLFGATGDLGGECLIQCLDAGHTVTALVRKPEKLAPELARQINLVQGDGLILEDVISAMPAGTDAVLFAVGVDEKTSPKDLCTKVTANILSAMRSNNVPRLVWCGGGSNILADDVVNLGSRFVRWYGEVFLKLRHFDKEHQLALLENNKDLCWLGVRPLQMKHGEKKQRYRLGYNAYSGMSKIHFADCAHAMLAMLIDDTWVGKAPIIQY